MSPNRSLAPLLIAYCLLIGLDSGRASPVSRLEEETPDAEDVLGPGWSWELPPGDLPGSWLRDGFKKSVPSGYLSFTATREGGLFLEHVHSRGTEATGSRAPVFRPLVLDEEGKAVGTRSSSAMGRDNIFITRYSFMPTPPEKIARVGFAVLDFEGKKKRSRLALEKAKREGAEVLPFPVIGEPFSFSLPRIDGGRVNSKELLGRVVLLDCWATW